MGANRLQQVQVSDAKSGKRIPEVVIAACPNYPGVAAFDLVSVQVKSMDRVLFVSRLIHIVEVIFIRSGERAHTAVRTESLVLDSSGRRLLAATAHTQ
jgi:hypothetical protein